MAVDKSTRLTRQQWWAAAKRAAREFKRDGAVDLAAALTYYGILSIFPGLLVLVSVLGLLGKEAIEEIRDVVRDLAPGQVGDFIDQAIIQVSAVNAAGIVAVVGLLVAFWSASGYVSAFMRATNAIHEVPEGGPAWKKLPVRLAVTAVIGLLLVMSAVIVVFTGNLAARVGELIGVGSTAVTVWNIAKWPVLLVLVSLMLSILYWATPVTRPGGFRWITPGGLVAVLVWLLVSAGFAVYVANFSSYNRTYGAIAGVIVFLVWLWLSNCAILLGAELDAELERERSPVDPATAAASR